MHSTSNPAHDIVVTGGQCLVDTEGLVPLDIRCSRGKIVEMAERVSRAGAEVIDAGRCRVLPGIVDIHGDAFERQIMPRPKTMFPLDIAMLETDRQLASNGITTAYHGVTISWEPGLRGLDEARRVVNMLDRFEPDLLVDNRIHLRWETFAIDEIPDVISMMESRKTPLLAFNDHTTPAIQGARSEIKLRGSADRAMVDSVTYRALLDAAAERASDVPDGIRRISQAAGRLQVPMLSHDDCTVAARQEFRRLGVKVAEFPMNWETATEAGLAGDDIVLGAPNIVRGGSHNGAISARDAISRGLCSILASDYYYPASINAALALFAQAMVPVDQAWALVSSNPARVCGLADRGRIAIGLRADLLIVPEAKIRVMATISAGRIVYRSF